MWGNMLISARSLTSQILSYIPENGSVDRIQAAWPHAGAHSLRALGAIDKPARLVSPLTLARMS